MSIMTRENLGYALAQPHKFNIMIPNNNNNDTNNNNNNNNGDDD